MKTTRKSDSSKVQPARAVRRPEISAPRHRSTWEPIPLYVPVPEIPARRRNDAEEQAQPSRGVLIIQYGDES